MSKLETEVFQKLCKLAQEKYQQVPGCDEIVACIDKICVSAPTNHFSLTETAQKLLDAYPYVKKVGCNPPHNENCDELLKYFLSRVRFGAFKAGSIPPELS